MMVSAIGEARVLLVDQSGNVKDSRGFNNLITDNGLLLFSKIHFLATEDRVSQLAFGDGNTQTAPKNASMSALRNEVFRADIIHHPTLSENHIETGTKPGVNTCVAIIPPSNGLINFTGIRDALLSQYNSVITGPIDNVPFVMRKEAENLGLFEYKQTGQSFGLLNCLKTATLQTYPSSITVSEIGLFSVDGVLTNICDITPPITKETGDTLVIVWSIRLDFLVNPFQNNTQVSWVDAEFHPLDLVKDIVIGMYPLWETRKFKNNLLIGVDYSTGASVLKFSEATPTFTIEPSQVFDFTDPLTEQSASNISWGVGSTHKHAISSNGNSVYVRQPAYIGYEDFVGLMVFISKSEYALHIDNLMLKIVEKFNQLSPNITITNTLFSGWATNSFGELAPNIQGFVDFISNEIDSHSTASDKDLCLKTLAAATKFVIKDEITKYKAAQQSVFKKLEQPFPEFDGYQYYATMDETGLSSFSTETKALNTEINLTITDVFGRSIHPDVTKAQLEGQ